MDETAIKNFTKTASNKVLLCGLLQHAKVRISGQRTLRLAQFRLFGVKMETTSKPCNGTFGHNGHLGALGELKPQTGLLSLFQIFFVVGMCIKILYKAQRLHSSSKS